MQQQMNPQNRQYVEPQEFAYTIQEFAQFQDSDGNYCIIRPLDKTGRPLNFRDINEVFLIKKVLANMTKYFVKVSANGQLFDPRNSDHKASSTRVTNGIQYWRWAEIPKDGFESYMDYLKINKNVFYVKARTSLRNRYN